jgi:hypothetical protein
MPGIGLELVIAGAKSFRTVDIPKGKMLSGGI